MENKKQPNLKRLQALNLERLLQELKPKTQRDKLVTILDIYSRRVSIAEARVYFELINKEEFPDYFFNDRPTIATVITIANYNGITLKWKSKFGFQVYLNGCYFEEQYF